MKSNKNKIFKMCLLGLFITTSLLLGGCSSKKANEDKYVKTMARMQEDAFVIQLFKVKILSIIEKSEKEGNLEATEYLGLTLQPKLDSTTYQVLKDASPNSAHGKMLFLLNNYCDVNSQEDLDMWHKTRDAVLEASEELESLGKEMTSYKDAIDPDCFAEGKKYYNAAVSLSERLIPYSKDDIDSWVKQLSADTKELQDASKEMSLYYDIEVDYESVCQRMFGKSSAELKELLQE